ncbi:MAG: UDP-glucose 4-epimerase GalE, partial [Planctomycetes bacterium]|nr:UDP-glucose 4-epimerase GalE [Planctomycetota bacterium]
GHTPIVFDNLSTGHREAAKGFELVVGDLADGRLLRQTMATRGVQAVMHFAACSRVGESVAEPQKYFTNNVTHGTALLRAMLDAGVRQIVFSSTAAVYGNPVRTPIDEAHPKAPINPYGRSKLMLEQMLAQYAEAHGFACMALRYFNAAGAAEDGCIGEDHEGETHLIPLVLQAALGVRESVQIYGTDYPTADGTCIRDYIHVDDLAVAHVLGLNALKAGTAVAYNLGNGAGYSVREVVETARRVTGRPIAAHDAPRRPGDPPVLVASHRKISDELGWQPKQPSLAQIIESAWRWHKSHPAGFRSK